MTDAGQGSRPRNQPNLASTDADKGTDKDSTISQSRPALRFYEPLPLGSDAFMAPLAPPEEPRSVNGRRLAVYCIVGGALGIAFGGAALAFLSSTGTERPLSVRVMDLPQPATATPTPTLKASSHVPVPVPVPMPALSPPPSPTPTPPPVPPATSAPRASEPSQNPRRSSRREEATIDKPSRAQVIAAMAGVQPAVKACFRSTHGVATVAIKVQGSTGRVTSAQVSGQSGTIGSCVARAVRGAKFPRFTDESLSIRYPMAM